MCEGGARQLAIEEVQDNRAKRQEESRKKHKITKTLERWGMFWWHGVHVSCTCNDIFFSSLKNNFSCHCIPSGMMMAPVVNCCCCLFYIFSYMQWWNKWECYGVLRDYSWLPHKYSIHHYYDYDIYMLQAHVTSVQECTQVGTTQSDTKKDLNYTSIGGPRLVEVRKHIHSWIKHKIFERQSILDHKLSF